MKKKAEGSGARNPCTFAKIRAKSETKGFLSRQNLVMNLVMKFQKHCIYAGFSAYIHGFDSRLLHFLKEMNHEKRHPQADAFFRYGKTDANTDLISGHPAVQTVSTGIAAGILMCCGWK